MAGDALRNTLDPADPGRSLAAGDVPEALRRRYLTEAGRTGQGLGFYVDATTLVPSFRDRGGRLIATRSDPNAIRDMVAIARHRGWSTVVVRGAEGFRREAWLSGRQQGLEVFGYRPTERDLQVLARRQAARTRDRSAERAGSPSRPPEPRPAMPGDAQARMKVSTRSSARARGRTERPGPDPRRRPHRLAEFLERGARFGDLQRPARAREHRR